MDTETPRGMAWLGSGSRTFLGTVACVTLTPAMSSRHLTGDFPSRLGRLAAESCPLVSQGCRNKAPQTRDLEQQSSFAHSSGGERSQITVIEGRHCLGSLRQGPVASQPLRAPGSPRLRPGRCCDLCQSHVISASASSLGTPVTVGEGHTSPV